MAVSVRDRLRGDPIRREREMRRLVSLLAGLRVGGLGVRTPGIGFQELASVGERDLVVVDSRSRF